jgi:hypothetical protein
MKNKLLLFLIISTILNIHCFGQIVYEKGYYIDNSNQKIECFIKNLDWNNNPTKFMYKLTENGEKNTLDIKLVKEFGIGDGLKYVRKKVQIDTENDISKTTFE